MNFQFETEMINLFNFLYRADGAGAAELYGEVGGKIDDENEDEIEK